MPSWKARGHHITVTFFLQLNPTKLSCNSPCSQAGGNKVFHPLGCAQAAAVYLHPFYRKAQLQLLIWTSLNDIFLSILIVIMPEQLWLLPYGIRNLAIVDLKPLETRCSNYDQKNRWGQKADRRGGTLRISSMYQEQRLEPKDDRKEWGAIVMLHVSLSFAPHGPLTQSFGTAPNWVNWFRTYTWTYHILNQQTK